MIEINLPAIITMLGIPSFISALGVYILTKKISRRDKAEEKREAAREKLNILMIKSTGAAIALSEAAALALKNGHTNGETEKALEYARQVKREQRDFLFEQGVCSIVD